MDDIFITKIDIEKSRNLENVSIPLSETERKHLILTGRNGSGKTSLLNELEYILDFRDFDANLRFPAYQQKRPIKISYSVSEEKVFTAWETNSFVKVFFAAERKSEMVIPRRIEKLDILNQSQNTNDNLKQYFLQFLVNLVADRLFANEDNDQEAVKRINKWFDQLKDQLKVIFETDSLELEFKRREYSFDIKIPGKEPFGFEVLSDGYSSIIGVIAELILRMERMNRNGEAYDIHGVVLIDEIETHLHVSLQKIILPFLIDLFPKIQFIVSTHSPFILSSISNAVIFDLENKSLIEDLSLYSYDAIIESYFDLDKYSIEMNKKMKEYDELLSIKDKTPEQIHQFRQLKYYFDNVPTYKAPELRSKLLEIELRSIKSKTVAD